MLDSGCLIFMRQSCGCMQGGKDISEIITKTVVPNQAMDLDKIFQRECEDKPCFNLASY